MPCAANRSMPAPPRGRVRASSAGIRGYGCLTAMARGNPAGEPSPSDRADRSARVRILRRPARDVRLTGCERRALRRLEDAAVADDPLLDLRLGLVAPRCKRVIVCMRRRAKSFARYGSRSAPAVVGGVVYCVLLACLYAMSAAAAVLSMFLVPSAFGIGVIIGRRRAPEASSPSDRHSLV